MILFYWPGPPLSIHLLHTILAGCHFPPKINDDFCLAFYLKPSSMCKSQPALGRVQQMQRYIVNVHCTVLMFNFHLHLSSLETDIYRLYRLGIFCGDSYYFWESLCLSLTYIVCPRLGLFDTILLYIFLVILFFHVSTVYLMVQFFFPFKLQFSRDTIQ